METPPPHVWEQINTTYEALADHSPDAWASDWWFEESAGKWHIGCPDMPDRPALIALIEAARALCGMRHADAQQLAFEAFTMLQQRPLATSEGES